MSVREAIEYGVLAALALITVVCFAVGTWRDQREG